MTKTSIRVQAPGRINLIGEHTDYNEGFVLPAAIDKKAVFTLKSNGSKHKVNATAGDLGESFSFDLESFQPIASGWPNYVMGVVNELQKLGATLAGFDMHFNSNIPIGAGMSSSAALECGLAFGLNELFDLGLGNWQLIKAGQMAEHHFAGIKCGIMDQFASVMGKKNHVLLLDCRSLEFEYFPFDLKEYQLLLLNSKVSHTLATSEYNTRRAECEEGLSLIQKEMPTIKSLRDLSVEALEQFAPQLPSQLFRRCHHVVTENQRVLESTQALVKKDFDRLGRLLYASHSSLQKDYEVTCPELDFLVQLTLGEKYVLGSRMMGGGFGGCTLNIVEKSRTDQFVETAAKSYQKHFGIELSPYWVSIENGAGLIQ